MKTKKVFSDQPFRTHLSWWQSVIVYVFILSMLVYKIDFEKFVENPISEMIDAWGLFLICLVLYFSVYHFYLKKKIENGEILYIFVSKK